MLYGFPSQRGRFLTIPLQLWDCDSFKQCSKLLLADDYKRLYIYIYYIYTIYNTSGIIIHYVDPYWYEPTISITTQDVRMEYSIPWSCPGWLLILLLNTMLISWHDAMAYHVMPSRPWESIHISISPFPGLRHPASFPASKRHFGLRLQRYVPSSTASPPWWDH